MPASPAEPLGPESPEPSTANPPLDPTAQAATAAEVPPLDDAGARPTASLRRPAGELAGDVARLVRQKPTVALAAAAGLGALVGVLIKR
jgi:hypothetical protein